MKTPQSQRAIELANQIDLHLMLPDVRAKFHMSTEDLKPISAALRMAAALEKDDARPS